MLKSESLGFFHLPGSNDAQIGRPDLQKSATEDLVQSCSKMLLTSGK